MPVPEAPMAERLARALVVFSRARAANERRLRREIEPMTEPVSPGVPVNGGLAEEAVAEGEATAGRHEAEEEARGRESAGEVETGAEMVVEDWEERGGW